MGTPCKERYRTSPWKGVREPPVGEALLNPSITVPKGTVTSPFKITQSTTKTHPCRRSGFCPRHEAHTPRRCLLKRLRAQWRGRYRRQWSDQPAGMMKSMCINQCAARKHCRHQNLDQMTVNAKGIWSSKCMTTKNIEIARQ